MVLFSRRGAGRGINREPHKVTVAVAVDGDNADVMRFLTFHPEVPGWKPTGSRRMIRCSTLKGSSMMKG